MRKFVSSILTASLLGASLAVPLPSMADELPLCSQVADPATTPCTGPTGPTGTTEPSSTEPTGPTGPTGTTEATGSQVDPECSTVADPATTPCTGPAGPTGAPEYDWFWNGTAWEAEGYPYVWNGTQWVPAPPPQLSATNENTGPNSDNTSEATVANPADADLSNDATINNSILANLLTGGNTVSHNTTAGNLTTGNIKASVELMNFINSVMAVQGGSVTMADLAPACDTDPATPDCDIDLASLSPEVLNAILAYYVGSIFEIIADNTNTGPDSANTANSSAANNTDVDANQDATINNTVDLTANTGHNNASYNTQVGDVTTGNIDVVVNLINVINSILSVPVLDIAMLNVFGDLFGNIFVPDWGSNGGATFSPQIGASNETTGPDSSNTATGAATNTVDVDVVNTADIGNGINLSATTGGNNLSNNTTAGNLTTGAVDMQLTLSDVIRQITGDSWFLIFVNVLGEWTGQILGIDGANGEVVVITPAMLAANSNTGPDSSNAANASLENTLDVDAENKAAINNNLNLDLSTGNNTVASNTTAGNLTTGNINVIGNIMNMINQAVNLNKKLFLGFVNILGDWVGSIGPRSAFPAVGGNPTNETVIPPAPIPTVASSETAAASPPSSSVVRSGRLSPLLASAGEIASGASIALVSPTQFTALTPEVDQPATGSALSPWRMISLGLVVLGILLLLADTILRRRRYNK